MKNFKTKKADMELIYKRADGLNLPLNVYLPSGNISNAQAVVLIHGGSWTDAITDNSEWNGGWMASNAKYLAEKGFISIAISYRSLKISDKISVVDILEDCTDAIIFIKNHLKFVNFKNIVYIGESAGGYIATMLGLSQNDEVRPWAVISLNPVLEELSGKWNYGFKNCTDIEKLTPIKIIGEKCSNFLFVHGDADTTVDIKYTEALNELLLKRKHKSHLIKIPSACHAFCLYDYKYDDEYVTQIMEQIVGYIQDNF